MTRTQSVKSLPARRVVFIGGLADGRMAVQELLQHPAAEVVAAFVLDDDAGRKVSGFVTFDDLLSPPVLRKIHRIRDHAEEIRELHPDLIFVVGLSQIIPAAVLRCPALGTIGFHSALLPGRRGCSPLIWAIVDGLTETGVSMFWMDEGIDTGDVIGVEPFAIAPDEAAAAVLAKADAATRTLMRRHLDDLLAGRGPRTKQDESLCTYTRKRTAADGEIDWSRPAREVFNLIRALTPPYPMAHAYAGDGVPILIEKARLAEGAALPPPRFLPDDPMRQRVLCVVAHPDDEVLGIGGTLALHAAAGGEVVVVILSEGEDAKLPSTRRCVTRRECALDCAKVLGIRDLIFHDFPDQRLDAVPLIDIIKSIEAAVAELRPTVVYTHHGGDANSDHLVTFRAAYAACRPMTPLGAHVRRLLAFETPSSTDQAPQVGNHYFCPSTFVDIEPVWEKKLEALRCYPTEMVGGIHPRSYEYIEALARMRGGYAGFKFAEAFVCVRERLARPSAAYASRSGPTGADGVSGRSAD